MAEAAIEAVVGKLFEDLADALKKQVSYLCCYSCNVQTLSDEIRELNIRHVSVQQDVDAAKDKLEIIRPEVESWFEKVKDVQGRSSMILGDAEEVQRNCMRKWFPVLQYSLSKKAMDTTADSVDLRNTNFVKISNPGMPAEIAPVPSASYVGFKSRDLIEERIMDALKDASVYSIGIWGIGGVGKTTMAEKIEKRVRDEKSMFEHVVMVVVSRQPDLLNIQSQIAKALRLPLSEESPVYRSRKLHQRLMTEKSILIILDDLWRRLDLEELGIPSQSTHAGCKLILTSRNRDALTSTGVSFPNIFPLGALEEEESWKFFKDSAGILEDGSDNDLVQIAKRVEKECQRLPLALKIVGCALRGRGISFWNTAARELEKSVPDNIPDVTNEVYRPLRYSFDLLEGKEQKDLFMLCCLFPEDYSISVEELLRCGVGLTIFKGHENLTIVRDKVETLLKLLLSRSLLIEGHGFMDSLYVRMHDVIRDVGIWIATEGMIASNEEKGWQMVKPNKEKHVFMVNHGEKGWPMMEQDSYNNCTCLSLLFCQHDISFPELVYFPKLEFLRLDLVKSISVYGYHVMLPEDFFNGMVGLRVLEALHIHFPPPSIGQLNNLHTLHLLDCKNFETVSVLGKLINLKILSLVKCEFEALPLEIGGLKKLKLMDIRNCNILKGIAFGVISKLIKLEEIVILDSFDSWEAELGGEKDIACLSELNGLKNLTTLKIEIRNPIVVPKEKPLWVQKVQKYNITVSKCTLDFGKEKFQKAISLGKEAINPLGHWIYNMASDAEYLNLEGSNCMRFVDFGNLSCLKQLKLVEFNNVRYLVEGQQNSGIFPMLESLEIIYSASLQQISQVSPPIGSFVALQRLRLDSLHNLTYLWKFSVNEQLYLGNLTRVDIDSCDNLSYLFPLYVARGMVQLSYIQVSSCRTIKEIFKKEDGELLEVNKIELPKLSFVSFHRLDSFCRLCNGFDKIELPGLRDLFIDNLPSIKMTEGDNNDVQQYLIPKIARMSFNFCGLQFLTVKGIWNFKCMFSSSVIRGVPNLHKLQVESCSMLEQVIGKDHENLKGTIIFPNLKELDLRYLPNIHTFCYNAIELPSLERLHIVECPQMLSFVEALPDGISNSRPFINKQVQCPKLEDLSLYKLNILGVFSYVSFKSLKNLEVFDVRDCVELKHIITKEEAQTTDEEFIHRIPSKKFGLSKLPKLHGYVFHTNKHLEFPSLEEITIEDCPMLKNFSLGSLHMPKLKIVSGLLNAELATNFFFHKEISSYEIYSENNGFIIPIKDISFSFSTNDYDIGYHILAPDSSSRCVVNAVTFPIYEEIVGKFKIGKIQIGIEYEIMLMIMLDEEESIWEDPIDIEVNLLEGNKLQPTKILENQRDMWTEISMGRFIRVSQQSEELEFVLRAQTGVSMVDYSRRLSIKGVRIVKI